MKNLDNLSTIALNFHYYFYYYTKDTNSYNSNYILIGNDSQIMLWLI